MATEINAGRVAMVPKGEWSASTAYTRLDVVQYNGSSYVASQDSTGQNPSTATNYWQLLARGVDPSNYYTKTETNTKLGSKQDALVSGQNIKSINGQSVLGSGNLELGELFVVRMTRNNSNSVYTADKSVSEIYEASYTNGKPVIAVMRDISNPVFILADCNPDGDSYVFSAIESNTVTTLRWKRTDDYTYELETMALQPHLVSGTNIKTVNNESLLGSGDIVIPAGATGPQGPQGIQGPKGDQGNSGYTGAAGELEVVNNLTDGGATAALSAEMGKTLNNKKIDTNDIVDSAVTLQKAAFVESENLVNPSTLHIGYVYNRISKSYNANASYNATEAIQVQPNTTYYHKAFSGYNASMRIVDLYDANFTFKRELEYKSSFTTASDEVYVYITYYSSGSNYYLGTTLPTTFVPYNLKIPGSLINTDSLLLGATSIQNGSIITNKIADSAVTLQKTSFAESENLVNPNALHIGYTNASSTWEHYDADSNYKATEVICVKPNTKYYCGAFNNGTAPKYINLFTENQQRTRLIEDNYTFTTASDEVYVYITYLASTLELYLWSTVPQSFVPYGAKIPGSLVSIESSSLGDDLIQDNAITTNKIAGGNSNLMLFDSDSLNKIVGFYSDSWKNGTYNSVTKAWFVYQTNSLYSASATIKLSPNTTYYCSVSCRFIKLSDANYSTIRVIENASSFTTGAAEVYAIFTTYNSQAKDFICSTEQTITYPKIKNIYLPAVESYHAPHVNCVSNSSSLAQDETITLTYIPVSKNVAFSTQIRGAISSVLVGVGYMSFYGTWFEITDTQIKMYSGTDGTLGTTVSHGLTLTNETFILFSSTTNHKLDVTLSTDLGDTYTHQFSWGPRVGTPFVKNLGSASISCTFKFMYKDIKQKIWMFGDSYFTYTDPARWCYYLLNAGFTSQLLVAQGGESATQALNDITNLIALKSYPEMVFWCQGMNGGTDGSNAPNSNWLTATQSMISLCESYNITPVLCTIPSIPDSLHVKMNEWIRSSGYRYVDVAEAVESTTDGDYYWKGWGTGNALLSSDLTHPTSYGAKVIYGKIIADLPELTLKN